MSRVRATGVMGAGGSVTARMAQYMVWAIRQAAELREAGNELLRTLALNGAWSALRGLYGPPGARPVVMPGAHRRVILRSPY